MKRSQLSLELLIVLASSFSLLLALTPAYKSAGEKTRQASVDALQEKAFAETVDLLSQAQVFGRGFETNASVYFPTPAGFAFDNKTQSLQMHYANGGKVLSKTLGFFVSIETIEVGKGTWQIHVENNETIALRLTPIT